MSIVWNTILKMDTKHSRTYTTLFLLPLFERSREKVITVSFINSFICEEFPSIITKYGNEEDPIKVELPFNKAVKETIKYFTEGRYSQIPNQHKQTILQFWGAKKGSKLHNILYPEYFHIENYGRPIKAEIWPKPNMKLETYKP